MALVAVAVVGSAIAIGGVHTPVLVAIALVVSSALFWIWGREPVPPPSWIAFALAGFCAIQALPIPSGLLRAVAPRNSEVWTRVGEITAGSAPQWSPISLDPGASLVEALKWFTYGMTFFVGWVFAKHSGSRWSGRIVFGSALLVAVLTIAHGLAGASKLYGFYHPSFIPARWGMGPLLNTNNLAAYLNIGILCGVALLLIEESPVWRWVWALGSATLLGTSILSASRGGLLVLPVGIVILAVLLRSRRSGARLPRAQLVAVTLTLAAGVALATIGATRGTWRELFDANTQKLQIIGWSKPMIRDHLWLGVGRGAFDGAFPAYSLPDRNLVFSHAENLFVQWVAEWGAPVAIVALLTFAWTLRPKRFRPWRPMRAAAWATLVVLVLHNLFDLGMEVPALMIALSLLLGANWEGGRNAAKESTRSPLGSRIAIGGAAFALASTALAFGLRTGAGDRARIARVSAAHVEIASLEKDLRACVRRHPADPYFPRLMALLVYESGGDALPWLGHALERDLRNGRTHLLLARVLRARGAVKQALLELRLAADSDAELAGPVAGYARTWASKPDDLMRAVPDGATGAQVLVAMSTGYTLPAEEMLRAELLHEAIARDPNAIVPRKADAQDLLRSLEKGTARCAESKRAACIQRVRDHVESLAKNQPKNSASVEIRARLMSRLGDLDGAEKLLSTECAAFENSVDCMKTRFDLAVSLRDSMRLEAALTALLDKACPQVCARTATWAGEILASDPRHAELALVACRRAAQTDPTLERLVAYADAAGRTGRHAEAVGALDRASRMTGANDKLKQRLEEERARALTAQ